MARHCDCRARANVVPAEATARPGDATRPRPPGDGDTPPKIVVAAALRRLRLCDPAKTPRKQAVWGRRRPCAAARAVTEFAHPASRCHGRVCQFILFNIAKLACKQLGKLSELLTSGVSSFWPSISSIDSRIVTPLMPCHLGAL